MTNRAPRPKAFEESLVDFPSSSVYVKYLTPLKAGRSIVVQLVHSEIARRLSVVYQNTSCMCAALLYKTGHDARLDH